MKVHFTLALQGRTCKLLITLICYLKVMLLANPSIEELYHKSCALAEDSQEVKDSFQHPARLIKVPHTLFMLVPCALANNDAIVLFHCWVCTMWKNLNWCWLLSFGCRSVGVWLFGYTTDLFVFVLVCVSTPFLFFPSSTPCIHTLIFILI